jgi:SAM-dependent methyltransferase
MQVWQEQLISKHQPGYISVFSKLLSELYDQSWYATFSPAEVEFFASHIQTKTTLEIASGTGRVTIPLLDRGIDLYGIEGSLPMFQILQSKLSTEQRDRFILWDARQTPYPAANKTFEAVIVPFSSFGLIHNGVSELGSNRIFREFGRLLRVGGWVIINDYRTGSLDHNTLKKPEGVWLHYHQHPEHGQIREEQYSRYEIVPNRILPKQVIRRRRTVFLRERDGTVLEEHLESVPLWDVNDYPVLGEDAGFSYRGGEKCHFHQNESIQHVFQKK